MTPYPKPMSNLASYIAYLEDFVKRVCPNNPGWDSVKITFIDLRANKFARVPAAINDFEGEFSKLRDSGYRWINLSAYGKIGETLIVAIELPEKTRTPPDKVSVNISGPNTNVQKIPNWQIENIYPIHDK